MEKLDRQLAEAEAALEARKKPPEETGPRIVGEGLVIDEWVIIHPSSSSFKSINPYLNPLLLCDFFQKERRERYLAKQQGEGVDSA